VSPTGDPTAAATPIAAAEDFSLVLGGPLYQIFRRAHLTGETLELLRRRIIALTLLAWLPLLVLSVVEGHAWGSAVAMPFLKDLDAHVRFLLALPLLVVAELVVHQRMRPMIGQFVRRGLVTDASLPQFEAALDSARRLRNSVLAEVALIVLVYAVGVPVVWRLRAVEVASWYGGTADGVGRPSLAGWWFVCVSLPLFQFIFVRWVFRLLIWARFLWQVSGLPLAVVPTHPDGCGGLGFLGGIPFAFAPWLLAQGALLSGNIANRIVFGGATLPQFKIEIISVVGMLLFAVLGPLLIFARVLAPAKRLGLREYGLFAQDYVRSFDRKWLRGGAPPAEDPLGSGDIQSLADLGNSFAVVRGMKLAPFSKETVLQLTVLTLLPLLPLTLTMISLEQLLERLLKIAF
jgi:hypothetical protein